MVSVHSAGAAIRRGRFQESELPGTIGVCLSNSSDIKFSSLPLAARAEISASGGLRDALDFGPAVQTRLSLAVIHAQSLFIKTFAIAAEIKERVGFPAHRFQRNGAAELDRVIQNVTDGM